MPPGYIYISSSTEYCTTNFVIVEFLGHTSRNQAFEQQISIQLRFSCLFIAGTDYTLMYLSKYLLCFWTENRYYT